MADITTRAGKGSPLTNTEVDDNFTNLKTEVETATSDISSLEDTVTGVGGHASRISTLETDLNTAEGEIDVLQSDVSDAQGDISTLQGRVTVAEGDIATKVTQGADSSITSLSGITGGVGEADYVDFDIDATSTRNTGRLRWSADDQTLEVDMAGSDVTQQIGQELLVYVYNNDTTTIYNGEVVYFQTTANGNIAVKKFIADGSIDYERPIGVATEDIPFEGYGYAVTFGAVRGLDTSSYSVGDALYASHTTAGAVVVGHPPSPNYPIHIGNVVEVDATSGQLWVNVWNHSPADESVYDNSDSTLTSSNVKAALDELDTKKADLSLLSSNINLYPTTAASDVTGYGVLVNNITDDDFNDTATNVTTGELTSTTDALIGSLASAAGIFDGDVGGTNVTIVGNIRRTDGNDAGQFKFEVYHRTSGGTETLIGTSGYTDEVTTSNYTQYFASTFLASQVFGETDRVVLKLYGKLDTSGSATFDFQYGGGEPVRALFPVAVTVVPTDNDAVNIQTDTSAFNSKLSGANTTVQSALDTLDDHGHGWGEITGTPTTLSGYGITDGATSSQGALADSAMQNLVDDITPQLGGTLDANGHIIDMGANNITDAKVGNWNTAYLWGDHSTAGYAASSSLATVATSGSYTDLSNKPTYATVASTGSYNDLSDTPAIPADPAITTNGALPSLATGITGAEVRSLIGAGTSSFDGAFSSLSGKPTTISGYGITDAFDGAFSSLSGKPTTIAGYGITDAFSGAFSALSGKPTTIAGYGITDAFDGEYSSLSGVPSFASVATSGSYNDLINKPTIISTADVQSTVANMVTGNSESGISVVYQTSDNTLDFNVNDPTITLSGVINGSATMTNLGNVTISTTHTSDPTITLAGDLSGSATLTNLGSATLTATVANDSHSHSTSTITAFTESVQDIVGAMFSGNSESGLSATYQDADGTIDLALTNDPTISLTGAVTATGTMTNLGNLSLSTTLGSNTVSAGNIVDNSVGAAELNVSGNGTTSQYLRADGDGSFTWATPPDTNTTYSAGRGLDLSGTQFLLETDLRDSIDYIGKDSGDYLQFVVNSYHRHVVNGAERLRIESDGDLHADGDVIAYSTTISDERLKDNIEGISDALIKVGQLNGYTFKYKADGKISAGVIAQEVEAVLPEAVSEKQLPLKTDDDEPYKVVNYDAIHGLLIEAIKELTGQVEELQAKVDQLSK